MTHGTAVSTSRPSNSEGPIRILHIDECFKVGTYRVIHDITQLLSRDEFEFTVLFGNRSEKTVEALAAEFPNVNFVPWKHARRSLSASNDTMALWEAIAAIRRLKPDVIHAHSAKAGTLARIAALLTGRIDRTLYTPHGLSFLQQNESRGKRALYRRIEQLVARIGGEVIACSPSELAVLNDAGIHGIQVVNGVRVPISTTPIPDDIPRVVLAAGRLEPAKNPAAFNEIARAFEDDASVRFVWAGGGELRRDLTSANIEVTGWLTNDEVRQRMRKAHVYLSTSLFEGLPLAVLEAMSEGRPLLLSSAVGHVDLISDNNGYLFHNIEDAVWKLTRMLQSITTLRNMGTASRDYALANFDAMRMTQEYAALYRTKAKSENYLR